MNELSIFIDESGDAGPISKYYLVSLVLHEQNDPIQEQVSRYEKLLRDRSLDLIPFHFGPLLMGNDDYEWKGIYPRKQQLVTFANMCQRLPFKYICFSYEKRGALSTPQGLSDQIESDVERFLEGHLEYLQSFGKVKIYYDGGQSVVTRAIHSAIEAKLSKRATFFKNASPKAYVLSQVADYVCGIELIAIKFARNEQTKTDTEFFTGKRPFKKNYLSKLRKKLL